MGGILSFKRICINEDEDMVLWIPDSTDLLSGETVRRSSLTTHSTRRDLCVPTVFIALKWVKSSKCYNVIRKDERECGRKTERNLEMIYGETLRIINKPMFSSETYYL